MRRLLHRLRDDRCVPFVQVEGEIARRLLPDRGGARGERRHAVDHGRQRLIVDLDKLGRRAGDLLAVGHDEGHRVADMAHAALGEGRPRRHDQRLHRRHAGQRTEAIGREIGRGIDAVHAGQRRGLRNVDPLYERMRVRRAQDMAVQLAGIGDIVDIMALPGQEAAILEPPHRAADHRIWHLFLSALAHAAPPDKLPGRTQGGTP